MMEQRLEKEALSELDKSLNKEIEIDLIDILRKIITYRRVLYKAAGIGLIVGVVVALSMPSQYTVQVTLSPEIGNSKGSGGLAGLAASFLGNGVTMGETVDALNASLSADIVSSTPFLLEILNMQVIVSPKGDRMDLGSYLDHCSSPWWSYIIGFPSLIINGVQSFFKDEQITDKISQGAIELSKEENDRINFLKNHITAGIDKKTAITSISVTLQDPKVTAIVADSIIHKLQEYIINYPTFKAKEDCAYLSKLFEERKEEYYVAQGNYADYMDSHDDLILQSVRAEQERLQNDMNLAYQVYSQVANQLQVARAKVQEEKPIFAVVEPAVVPLEPSGVSKKVYVLLFVCIAVICTGIWILFGKDILLLLKNEIKK